MRVSRWGFFKTWVRIIYNSYLWIPDDPQNSILIILKKLALQRITTKNFRPNAFPIRKDLIFGQFIAIQIKMENWIRVKNKNNINWDQMGREWPENEVKWAYHVTSEIYVREYLNRVKITWRPNLAIAWYMYTNKFSSEYFASWPLSFT